MPIDPEDKARLHEKKDVLAGKHPRGRQVLEADGYRLCADGRFRRPDLDAAVITSAAQEPPRPRWV